MSCAYDNRKHKNIICASGSVVEYRLAKARVAGSNPVSRCHKNRGISKADTSIFMTLTDRVRSGTDIDFGRKRMEAHMPTFSFFLRLFAEQYGCFPSHMRRKKTLRGGAGSNVSAPLRSAQNRGLLDLVRRLAH